MVSSITNSDKKVSSFCQLQKLSFLWDRTAKITKKTYRWKSTFYLNLAMSFGCNILPDHKFHISNMIPFMFDGKEIWATIVQSCAVPDKIKQYCRPPTLFKLQTKNESIILYASQSVLIRIIKLYRVGL